MQHTKIEIRERLLDSAFNEFTTYGYEKASLRRIVSDAQSSLGNLYRYYENKEALYSAIVDPMIEDCISNIAEIDFSSTKRTKTAAVMVDFFIDRQQIFNVLQKGPYASYSNFLLRLADAVAHNIRSYAENNKNFKEHSIINMDFYQVFAWSFISGMQKIMEHSVNKDTTTKYMEELLFVLFDGLESRIT